MDNPGELYNSFSTFWNVFSEYAFAAYQVGCRTFADTIRQVTEQVEQNRDNQVPVSQEMDDLTHSSEFHRSSYTQ